MEIRPEVVQRILLAKSILAPYESPAWGELDAHTVARQVLASHDAADLILAAIADHQGKLQGASSNSSSMVGCLDLIKVKGKGTQKPATYFRDLNKVRNGLKHSGVLPNTQQWGHVGRETYQKLSELCRICLGQPLDCFDESELLTNREAKEHFAAAKASAEARDYRITLAELGKALCVLLDASPALSGIHVGEASAEQAIKLSGFGVHANSFLRLQEFLPKVWRLGDGPFHIAWEQSKFGHPGNWREDAVQFCLQAFLQAGLRIQGAGWIPPAFELGRLYAYRVTAREEVDIWREVHRPSMGLATCRTKESVGHLAKGQSVEVHAGTRRLVGEWFDEQDGSLLTVVRLWGRGDLYGILGGGPQFVLLDGVSITCFPEAPEVMRELFPGLDLPETPWAGDDAETEE